MPGAKQKTAVFFSFAPVPEAARVLRQAESLKQDGWRIILCGYQGHSKIPEGMEFVPVVYSSNPVPVYDNQLGCKGNGTAFNKAVKKKNFFRKNVGELYWKLKPIYNEIYKFLKRVFQASILFLSRFSKKISFLYYWKFHHYGAMYRYIEKELEPLLKNSERILFVAHDYFTCPFTERLAEKYQSRYVVDIHEYARGQYLHDWRWRFFFRPWVDRLQRHYLRKSAGNTVVCEGIGQLIHQDYPEITQPLTSRSTSSYREMPLNPVGDTITLLYSGIIYDARGIDLAIQTLALLPDHFRLVLRGPQDSPRYPKQYKDMALNLGVSNRLSIEQPLPYNQIIPAANQADIGFYIQKDISPQKRYALPNKFFDYITAGLMLCVSDLPEMGRIVKQYDLGILIDTYTPEAVAEQLKALTPEQINLYKKNALESAKDLCWENESRSLLELYNRVIDEPKPNGKNSDSGNEAKTDARHLSVTRSAA